MGTPSARPPKGTEPKQPDGIPEENKAGFFPLLERVRRRPGMYCDPENQPLSTLETMFHGYQSALADHDVPEDGRGFTLAFPKYLRLRYGWSTSCGWAVAIRDHLRPGDDELSRFFALADEFRAISDQIGADFTTIAGALDSVSLGEGGTRRMSRVMLAKRVRVCLRQGEPT